MSENTKTYELRALTADDIFPMLKIISKIGIKEFRSCFETETVRKSIASAAKGTDGQADLTSIGMTVMLDVAAVIISHLEDAKEDIYGFLSNLSGMKKKDIAALPMGTFIEMIVDVIKKDEFKDFFQVVSKLIK